MVTKLTFRHGVHPPENKRLAADQAIEVLPNPQKDLEKWIKRAEPFN